MGNDGNGQWESKSNPDESPPAVRYDEIVEQPFTKPVKQSRRSVRIRRDKPRLSNHRNDLRDMWIEEGRWELVRPDRDWFRDQCLLEGDDPKVAADKCWAYAESRYPRLTDEERELTKYIPQGRVDPRVFRNKKEATEREEVRWVAHALAVTGSEAKDAPSSQAWGLYQWAMEDAKNRDAFWKTHYPGRRVAPLEVAKSDEVAAQDDSSADPDAQLDELLSGFGKGDDDDKRD